LQLLELVHLFYIWHQHKTTSVCLAGKKKKKGAAPESFLKRVSLSLLRGGWRLRVSALHPGDNYRSPLALGEE